MKVNEVDRYSRRHNLRPHSVPEKVDDIQTRVRDICRAVLPVTEAETVVSAIDVVHKIGRPKDGGSNQPVRPIIIVFMSRTARDTLWKGSKRNDYLKNNRLHFKEDHSWQRYPQSSMACRGSSEEERREGLLCCWKTLLLLTGKRLKWTDKEFK